MPESPSDGMYARLQDAIAPALSRTTQCARFRPFGQAMYGFLVEQLGLADVADDDYDAAGCGLGAGAGAGAAGGAAAAVLAQMACWSGSDERVSNEAQDARWWR